MLGHSSRSRSAARSIHPTRDLRGPVGRSLRVSHEPVSIDGNAQLDPAEPAAKGGAPDPHQKQATERGFSPWRISPKGIIRDHRAGRERTTERTHHTHQGQALSESSTHLAPATLVSQPRPRPRLLSLLPRRTISNAVPRCCFCESGGPHACRRCRRQRHLVSGARSALSGGLRQVLAPAPR